MVRQKKNERFWTQRKRHLLKVQELPKAEIITPYCLHDFVHFIKPLRIILIGEQVKSVKIREIDGATIDLNVVRRRFCAGWLALKTAL